MGFVGRRDFKFDIDPETIAVHIGRISRALGVGGLIPTIDSHPPRSIVLSQNRYNADLIMEKTKTLNSKTVYLDSANLV